MLGGLDHEFHSPALEERVVHRVKRPVTPNDSACEQRGGGVEQLGKRVGIRDCVVVDQPQPLSAVGVGALDPFVKATRAALVDAERQHVDARVVTIEHLARPVSRGVVDDQDAIGTPALPCRAPRQLRSIVRRL